MNEKLMVMVALVSRNGAMSSVAIPSRVKTLKQNLLRLGATSGTAFGVFKLLRDMRGFDKHNGQVDDLLLAMDTSEAAGYPFPVSASLLRTAREAAMVPVAKPELGDGKAIGMALATERVEAIEKVLKR